MNLKLKASKPSCTTKSSAVTKQPVALCGIHSIHNAVFNWLHILLGRQTFGRHALGIQATHRLGAEF